MTSYTLESGARITTAECQCPNGHHPHLHELDCIIGVLVEFEHWPADLPVEG